jgi:hypothetical protein
MSQTVNIDGVGPVEFPDGMSQADMAHAIETELMPGLKSGGLKLGGASPAAQSPAAPTGPQSPLGGAIPTAAEMVAHGATGLASIGQEAGQVATNATDALRAVNSAVPFSDRLIAGYKTLAGGGDYSTNLAQEDAARVQLAKNRPMLNATGNALGTIGLGAALPLGVADAGASLLSRIVSGAATGAGLGSVQP